MMCMTAHQIYVKVHGGPGHDSLENARRKAEKLADKHFQLSGRVSALRARMEASWVGEAGAAAGYGAGPLTVAFEDSATELNVARDHLQAQKDSFAEVKRKVVEVPANPPEKSFWDKATPWDTDTEDDINKYNANAEQNVKAYNAYKLDSWFNGDRMPIQYANLPPDSGDVGVRMPEQGGPVRANPFAVPHLGSGGAGTGDLSRVGSASGATPGGLPPVASVESGSGTDAAGFVPDGPPRNTPGVPPGTTAQPAAGASGAIPVAGGFRAVAGSDGGGGASRIRGGAGVDVDHGGRGPGSGAVARGGGPGGLPAEGVAGRGGASGVGPGGMLGAGRRPDDEDADRERSSFLREPDPEGLFGVSEPTVPPVLGG